MAGKDITQKMLMEYNDVFADIVNGVLFHGEQVVLPEDLETYGSQRTQFKADDGTLHEQERDVAKLWKSKMIISLIGIENQTTVDYDMPLRVIGYDGASYKSQILGGKSARYPVITIVLYYGKDRWPAGRSLLERIDVPEIVRPFVSDYKINVVELSHLTDEEILQFKSDFAAIAEWAANAYVNPEYEPRPKPLKYVDETLKALTALSGDRRYEEAFSQLDGKENVTMCDVLTYRTEIGVRQGLQQGRKEGRAEGRKEGRVTGRLETRRRVYLNMRRHGYSVKESKEISEIDDASAASAEAELQAE